MSDVPGLQPQPDDKNIAQKADASAAAAIRMYASILRIASISGVALPVKREYLGKESYLIAIVDVPLYSDPQLIACCQKLAYKAMDLYASQDSRENLLQLLVNV